MDLDADTGKLVDRTRRRERRMNLGLGERYGSIARRVGGTNSEARFAWLLHFAQLRPEELDAAAAREAGEHLLVFALLQGVRGKPIADAQTQLATTPTIYRLRIELEAGLRSLTREGGTWSPVLPHIRRRFLRGSDRAIEVQFDARTIVDALLWSVGDLLKEHGDRLMACERKECDRLFLRHKRATYCSPRCSQLVRNARMREKLSPKARAARNRSRMDATTRNAKSSWAKR